MTADTFLAFATEYGLTMDEARVWLANKPDGFNMDTITKDVIREVVGRSLDYVRSLRDPDGINRTARRILSEGP